MLLDVIRYIIFYKYIQFQGKVTPYSEKFIWRISVPHFHTAIARSLRTIVSENYRWLLARGAISCNAETRVMRITASS